MVNWKILGTICGLCAAPFTGGLSLGMCAACTGLGFVAGSVIDKVSEDSGRQISQASPEAYDLLNKSIEENKRLLEELRNQYKQDVNKEKNLETKLEENRAKQKDPNLTPEEKEQLKNEELLMMHEIRKQRQNNEELARRIKDLEKNQADITNKGANVAGDSINNANWNNAMGSFKPSFTTKLIIAGAVVAVIYLLVTKH